MAKIPLERTIGATYSFVFANILSILGIIWLPYLLLAVLAAGLVVGLMPVFDGIDFSTGADWARDGTRVLQLVLSIGAAVTLFFLAAIVVRAMVAVGVMRKALGLHPGPVFVYFSLGAPVWRMIGATILAILAILAMSTLATAVVALIGVAASKFAPDAAPLLIGVAIFVGALWLIYAAVRISFFLPAVVVAENRIALGRSWQLGGGNFWRIIVLLLVVTLPVVLAASLIANALFNQPFIAAIEQMSESGRQIPPEELFALLIAQIRRVWPAYLVYEMIYLALLAALTSGAVANAYKGVTEEEANA